MTELSTWRARRAERAERRELACPLGDRDRERVRDHERADEERDAAEGEQELLQEGDELVGVLRRPPAPAPSPVRTCVLGRQDRRDLARRASPGETPGLAATAISSSLPSLSNSRCAVGRSKPASVAPPIVETAPNSDEPGDAQPLDGSVGLDADRSGRLAKSFLPAVDLSMTTSSAFGQAPSTRLSGLNGESPSVDAEAEVRRAAEDDRLAVAADQLCLAADAAIAPGRRGQLPGPAGAATRRTSAPRRRCHPTGRMRPSR